MNIEQIVEAMKNKTPLYCVVRARDSFRVAEVFVIDITQEGVGLTEIPRRKLAEWHVSLDESPLRLRETRDEARLGAIQWIQQESDKNIHLIQELSS